jgi:hypothetical protein
LKIAFPKARQVAFRYLRAFVGLALPKPVRSRGRLAELALNPLMILVVAKDRLAPVSAIENVIHGLCKFDACFSGHVSLDDRKGKNARFKT